MSIATNIEAPITSHWIYKGWIYLTLALAIAINLFWLNFAALFLIPKFQKLAYDGVIDLVYVNSDGLGWMPALLEWVYFFAARKVGWVLFALVVLAGLFEWRVKRPSKPFLRISVLATVALVLSIVSILVGVSLALPQLLSGPVTSRMAVTFARVQVFELEVSIDGMEKALARKDWEALQTSAADATQTLMNLEKLRPAVPGLWSPESRSVEDMRRLVQQASAAMTGIRQAITENDANEVERGLKIVRDSHLPLREAARAAR